MRRQILLFLAIVAIISISFGGCGCDPFDDLPKPGNCECTKCYIIIPPLFAAPNPFIIMQAVEITDESDNVLAQHTNFDITKSLLWSFLLTSHLIQLFVDA